MGKQGTGNKTVIITAAVCALIFLLAAGLVIYQYVANHAEATGTREIEILLDGEVIYKGSEISSGEPAYIEAKGVDGTNLIRIDANGACVESASCQNQECVEMGYLKSKYMPVVCLPNRLIIRYAEAQADTGDDMDAISK